MKLDTAISIFAGGPGSGCNPDVGKCGRKPGGGSGRQLSEKALRSLAHFRPMTARALKISKNDEHTLAKAVGGKSFKGNHPFDVLVGKTAALEVKSIVSKGANPKITIKTYVQKMKESYAKKNGIKKVFTVVFDHRQKGKTDIYYKGGVGAFRLSAMTKVNSLQELKGALGV